MRGTTALGTEDWFNDTHAFQWSFYCARLRSARGERRRAVHRPHRPAWLPGNRQDGIVQKILTLIGSGGKGIQYFIFGPEYNFPSNCYSENLKVLPQMAEAHRMIGKAEDVLWPGVRPRRKRPSSLRAARHCGTRRISRSRATSRTITNGHMNAHTVDYMAEVYDLYLALRTRQRSG